MRFKFFMLSLILCAAFSFGFVSVQTSASDSLDQSNEGVFFSAELLHDMMKRSNCDAIRFYSAQSAGNGTESVLAVSVSQGADMKVKRSPSTKYLLFTGIRDGETSISRLSKEEAAMAIKNVNGARLAVTIKKNELMEILSSRGCTGIEVIRATTSNGMPTFSLRSATLSENKVIQNSAPTAVISENPCPPSCGANLNQHYLSTISR
ncbi:MAG: hypothetical protein WBG42_06265 [Cryomorphaceae bacterium]